MIGPTSTAPPRGAPRRAKASTFSSSPSLRSIASPVSVAKRAPRPPWPGPRGARAPPGGGGGGGGRGQGGGGGGRGGGGAAPPGGGPPPAPTPARRRAGPRARGRRRAPGTRRRDRAPIPPARA